MAHSNILVLGSINTDLVIRGQNLPAPGETVLGGQFYRAHGGKGANQAVAAARASTTPVTLIGAVGDDPFGRETLAHFAAENLDCRYLKTVPGEPSGVALILVDRHGENSISVASGANASLLPEDVDAVSDEVFHAAKVFLTCLELPLETVAHGLARARRAGLLTILNPAPADERVCCREIMSLVDVITPNEGEAAALAGIDDRERAGAIAAVRKFQQLGCAKGIVTLGAAGCVVVEDDDTLVEGCSVEPVDTTGAGDAFNGVLAVGLAEGRSLAEAARWANRAAALAVTRAGAQPSLPTRTEIDAFADRQ